MQWSKMGGPREGATKFLSYHAMRVGTSSTQESLANQRCHAFLILPKIHSPLLLARNVPTISWSLVLRLSPHAAPEE